MKRNTHIKIWFLALAIIFLFSITDALAVEQGIFPKDPRAGLPPADLMPRSSANTNLNISEIQPTESDIEAIEGSNQNTQNAGNGLRRNNFMIIALWTIIISVIILFSVLIFLSFRESKN